VSHGKIRYEIDGRTLDHAKLEQIRLMAMKVCAKRRAATVIASYGLLRTTILQVDEIGRARGGLKA